MYLTHDMPNSTAALYGPSLGAGCCCSTLTFGTVLELLVEKAASIYARIIYSELAVVLTYIPGVERPVNVGVLNKATYSSRVEHEV